jgi:serine/threonine-protein kinase
MGIVYRAEDQKLRRAVALKVLPQAVAQDEERRRRFLREARSAAAINHPNIATVYEVDEADGRVFIAMELVEGGSLRARIRKGALTIGEAVRIARGIARGLARAHSKGVVHRDLKPDNVMLDEDGEPKILDFGLAKLREEQRSDGKSVLEAAETESQATKEGHLLGTPGYMAPEQVRGKPVDARTDVFAFGIVLYEMLAGEVPFGGESTMDVHMAVARDAHRPVRERNADVPEALSAVIDRCLAKSPDDRYPSAREVAEALEAVPISADPAVERVPAAAPSARTFGASVVAEDGPRRRPWAFFGVGAAVLVVLIAAVTWNVRSAPAPAGSGSAAAASVAAPDAAPRGVAVTDLPPPKTSSPEAAREYAQAMQAVRDASFTLARGHLTRAVELDPGFASALTMLAELSPLDEQRRALAAAAELRAQLGERDLALLEVLQATSEHDDFLTAEGWKRWRALAERFPLDSLFAELASMAALYAADEAEATRWVERARSLDPKSAVPEWVIANYRNDMGQYEAASAAADRCLTLSPAALSCLDLRAQVARRLGRCAQLEEDARTMIARNSRVSDAYDWLAAALVARGAPLESVAEAMRHARENDADPKDRAFNEVMDQVTLAQLVGDFGSAIATFPRLDQLAASSTSTQRADSVMYVESYLWMESGQPDRAVAVVDAYMKRFPALLRADPLGGRQYVMQVRRHAGRIPDAEFHATQEALAREAVDKLPPKFANNLWFDLYAEPVSSPLDAREALDALARYSPLPPYEGFVPNERAMGRVLLLAGRVDEAIAHLRRAMSACFSPSWIRSHQFGAELLGEALEAKGGDKAGACAAYAEVLAHWGNAKPRSLTAEQARAHMKSLGCPK